jgi:KUP system potassium uptake protein
VRPPQSSPAEESPDAAGHPNGSTKSPEPHERRGQGSHSPGVRLARSAIVIAALGVVFGDIGTSPIYTVATIFSPKDPHPVPPTTSHIYGVISLIFWSVTLIVTVQYVSLVLRADNDGEGGILALITLIQRAGVAGSRRTKLILAALGVFGASLFFGDSMITPAISVLSSVEGLKVVQPSLGDLVIPITAAIIIVLFALQRLGTAKVGRLFGPIMVVWFTAIAACGIRGIADDPKIIRSLSPTYALRFLFGDFGTAFFSLAAVVLAITGAEALYADLGHFGRGPITHGWLLLVFPACILSYMGQGALVLHDPVRTVGSPFFYLVPGWGRLPMVLLATAATVIASQAVITGSFSVASQAVQLGYLPRLRIVQTSAQTMGQIYVPWVNWALMIAVLGLVFAFRSSEALAFAFGMAVTCTITITTLLFFYVTRNLWKRPLWMVLTGGAFFLIIDLLFLTANLTKFIHGAWLPLLIGILVFTVMTTWQRGRQLITARRQQQEGTLPAFVEELHRNRGQLQRVPGTAVFLNRGNKTAPLAMRANVDHNHVLHEHAVILSLETQPVPFVRPSDRLVVDDLGHADDGITYVSVRCGYMQKPNVPRALRMAAKHGLEGPEKLGQISYFLSTIEIHCGDAPGMALWRKRLFIATSRLTADAAEYFGLPRDQTVIMGSRIEL